MKIIPIADADLFKFHQFRQQSARESDYVNPLTIQQVRMMIAEWSTEEKLGFVAVDNNKILGQLFLRPHYLEKDTMFLSLISVLKEAYVTGTSKSLMEFAFEQTKQHKCGRIKLIVSSLNKRAISFYTHMGFKYIGDFRKGKCFYEKIL